MNKHKAKNQRTDTLIKPAFKNKLTGMNDTTRINISFDLKASLIEAIWEFKFSRFLNKAIVKVCGGSPGNIWPFVPL